MCAQRLPASRRARPSWKPPAPSWLRRAQRLPASRRARLRDRADGSADAARAQRLPASRRARRAARATTTTTTRAQRLPASRRARHTEDCFAVLRAELCSTPSGITASATPAVRSFPAFLRAVLNAFRHHGERDLTVLTPKLHHHFVLNAFRHHGERDAARASRSAPAAWGAQRLPASRRARPCTLKNKEKIHKVLNAFRHHGERDRWGAGCGRTPGRRVLNAFRHHGERDHPIVDGSDDGSGAQRLPASRRARHAPQPFHTRQVVEWCSTPSGITASATQHLPDVRGQRPVCSTPSGITASATWLRRCTTNEVKTVLNAFRHHGERDVLGALEGAVDLVEVLNAFRHHGERDG